MDAEHFGEIYCMVCNDFNDLLLLQFNVAIRQSRRCHLDDFTAGSLIRRLEECRSVRDRLEHRFTNLENISNDRNSCSNVQQWSPTSNNHGERMICYIVLQVKKRKLQTAEEITMHMEQTSECRISRTTMARRLHKDGLYRMTTRYVCNINACSSEMPVPMAPVIQELDTTGVE